MKAIMVMFDSLNRRYLPPYGCDWVHAPNFQRLAERTVTFDNCSVGSMPCMPARREIHTGRCNFLHTGWGHLEPFDDSMPEMLKDHGVHTHLATDHYHYWEDGGATYHTKYSTCEMVRGQEGDPWIGQVRPAEPPPNINALRGDGGVLTRQDWVNRPCMPEEKDRPQARTFQNGLDYIERNHQDDNWFLTIETFDPHEPFFAPDRYRDLYPHDYSGPLFDWPDYARVKESPEEIAHLRYQYAALVSMCDAHLGKVLDAMDRHDLWDDTMLIVNTDHGYLLGEHGWWAKNVPPLYNEIAHIPLFMWDPRSRCAGERRQALVQTIDLAPTLLEYFGQELAPDMQGHVLRDTLAHDTPVRDAAIMGYFGSHLNCTDGRYLYMRGLCEMDTLDSYTMSGWRCRNLLRKGNAFEVELADPFSFTKGCNVMRIRQPIRGRATASVLYDLATDPAQEHPIDDPVVEARMVEHLARLMRENDAPDAQFERYGLTAVPAGH